MRRDAMHMKRNEGFGGHGFVYRTHGGRATAPEQDAGRFRPASRAPAK